MGAARLECKDERFRVSFPAASVVEEWPFDDDSGGVVGQDVCAAGGGRAAVRSGCGIGDFGALLLAGGAAAGRTGDCTGGWPRRFEPFDRSSVNCRKVVCGGSAAGSVS